MAGGDTPRISVRPASFEVPEESASFPYDEPSIPSEADSLPSQPSSQSDYSCVNKGSRLNVSDLQYYTEPDTTGMLGGSFANMIGPGFRLTGQTTMINMLHREVVLQALPPESRRCAQGIIDEGDIADLNSTIEWEKFVRTQTELEQNGPAFKLRLASPGNHCVKWRGTFDSPTNFAGGMAIVFRAQGESEFNKDVILPEHGHKARRLSKDVLVRRKFEFFHGKKTKPRITLNAKTDRDWYRGVDREGKETEASWLDKERVFKDFWRKTRTGEWEAVAYLPDYTYIPPRGDPKKRKKKPAWVHLSVFLKNEKTLPDGRVQPTYAIEIEKEGHEGVDIDAYRQKILESFYAEMLKQNPLAVFQPLGAKPRFYTEVLDSTKNDFVAKNRAGERVIGRWEDRLRVFKHFWREQEDGTWEAVVYFPKGGSQAEQKWIHLQAYKAEEVDLASGRRYTKWKMAIDTTDETTGSSLLGSLKGHISYIQTYLIEAFYDAQTSGDRNVGFDLVTHYSPLLIHNLRDSGFNRVLSDPRTKIYIHGHEHHRSYFDLMKVRYEPTLSDSTEVAYATFAEASDIVRKNPLPVVGVPSVMDYRTEVMQERFWVKPGTNDLVTEFEFIGVDEKAVPGSGPEVRQVMEEVAPLLFDYRRALEKITDKQTQEASHPETTLYKRVYLIGHLFHGLIMKQGYAGITKNDVLHAVNAKGETAVELYLRQIELSLRQAGLTEEASQLGVTYRKYAKELVATYEEVWSKRYDKNGGPLDEEELQRMRDEKIEKELELNLNGATLPLVAKIREQLETEQDPMRRHLLEQMSHMLPHLYGFMAREFRDWINGYESLKRKDRPDHEWLSHMDLFGGDHARSLEWYGQKFQRGTWAAAFGVHVQLEAQRIGYEYRKYRLKEAYSHQIPDRIRVVEHLGSEKERYVDLSIEMPTEDEIKERSTSPWEKSLLHTPGGVRALLPPPPKNGEPWEKWDTKTWILGFEMGSGQSRFGTSRGRQELSGFNGGPYFGYGHLWRLLDHAYRPMIQAYGSVSAHFIGQVREGEVLVVNQDGTTGPSNSFNASLFRLDIDLPVELGATIGDPLGVLAIRGFLLGGASLHEVAGGDGGGSDATGLLGVGLGLELAGGVLSLKKDWRWYPDSQEPGEWEKAKYYGIELDVKRLYKLLRGSSK
ncbi:MAG: hypothetical protein HYT76_07160 [Deltaproteobacteria bacterium]|nr:hypothetical protein [Deltaproteobacteria bacterium]